ncbi:MAG: hypothetical protein WCG25_10110 [bacterium]
MSITTSSFLSTSSCFVFSGSEVLVSGVLMSFKSADFTSSDLIVSNFLAAQSASCFFSTFESLLSIVILI